MGSFDDLIPKQAGSFADLIPDQQAQQPEAQAAPRETQRRGRSRTVHELDAPKVDPLEGLPENVLADIESRFPLPDTGDRRRRGQPRAAAISNRRQAAELEQIRLVKPELAELIESTGGLEAFLVGTGRGFATVGRGVGLAEQEDPISKLGVEGLKAQQPGAVGGGEILGETAPFLAAGGPVSAFGKTALTRGLAQGGLGATEGFVLAKGKGADTEQALKTAAITGPLAGIASLVPIGPRGARGGADELTQDIGVPAIPREAKVEAARQALREPTKKEIAEAVSGAAPSSQQLRDASKAIYNDLSESGVVVKPEAFSAFVDKALREANDAGLLQSKLGRKLTPQSSDILNVLEDMKTGKISFDELEGIRRAAQNSAGVANRAGNFADETINLTVVDSIDDFMKGISVSSFSGGRTNIGREVAAARDLWGRARKSEVLDEAIERAKSQQSGFENGIRIQFKQIIQNKKKSRFFSGAELDAMKAVERGTTTANTLRRIGKLGWGEGKQSTVLNALASGTVGGGATALVIDGSLAGGIGLILLPTVGTISHKLARNLTHNSARMTNQLIRAGADADRLAKVYLRNTPKAERSAEDLASLLMRPDLNLALVKSSTPIIQEAVARAGTLRQSLAASSAAIAVPAVAQEE